MLFSPWSPFILPGVCLGIFAVASRPLILPSILIDSLPPYKTFIYPNLFSLRKYLSACTTSCPCSSFFVFQSLDAESQVYILCMCRVCLRPSTELHSWVMRDTSALNIWCVVWFCGYISG
ncbi:hypothetical protein BO86DRAFT_8648 [Aspergillus japonicus CBS 114.51]|uniref:Uncharacterized protein n=1 Tax=Aspergillus japonicus CBS 114.51 TaxID=1448312 RepID=A0A8T8XH48_ASPJA|nr:hypothetical protein BO86DRAFT_8648 [Aspergillus japonicus CBS 114.51]RAH87693.1 hypothetical protein BO86DRAFT_8648 [Aspergillus japonicus CBS 114.51]